MQKNNDFLAVFCLDFCERKKSLKKFKKFCVKVEKMLDKNLEIDYYIQALFERTAILAQ